MPSRPRRFVFLFALLLLPAIAAVRARAQSCFTDDGLGAVPGSCCQPATLVLPTFPAITIGSKFVSFRDCGLGVSANVCVSIAAPTPVASGGATVCGVFLIRYTISSCGATPRVLWSGNMRAHYSRTWLESSTGALPPNTQVWRFLLNGDLVPSAFLLGAYGANAAVVPPCQATFGHAVHFWGYIDYALDCASNSYATAWVLNHDCDFSEHHPTGARPGVFHPRYSYDFLGPGATFMIDPLTIPGSSGNAVFEDVRKNQWATIPNICLTEEPATGVVNIINPFCPCTSSTGGGQFLLTNVSGAGTCGTVFNSPGTPTIPFIQKKIGMWTSAASYPGPEYVLLDQGFLHWVSGCGPANLPDQYLKGVETIGGWAPYRLDPVLSPLGIQFEDWGSANRTPNNVAPIIGAPYVTHFIVNLNI
jgi:hypothetical protein